MVAKKGVAKVVGKVVAKVDAKLVAKWVAFPAWGGAQGNHVGLRPYNTSLENQR